ncbi:MAG: response regulator [Gemmataceae bacterium]|nr:response regulator [Gemmataceae bacterium]MCI0741019.1 response regulator [Gemmataceae bacterium]
MARKALVVEDEKELGQLLGEHLKRWGYEPTVLNEGKPAVPWVRHNQPALILLDLLLPDIDGFSICETLKLDRDTNLIPVIMVTALSGDEDRFKGLQVGANRYLTKPFTADELHRAIDDAFAWQEDLKRNGAEGEIRFKLQSDTQFLEELNHLLGSLFLFSGLSETQVKQITTAVRELGTNAIEWGHQKQVERIVTVDYRIDAQKVTIIIKDTGSGFDPKKMPHAASDEDPVAHMMVREALGIREGGFGILMSRGLVDELKYNETGNEVQLVKYFPPKTDAKN